MARLKASARAIKSGSNVKAMLEACDEAQTVGVDAALVSCCVVSVFLLGVVLDLFFRCCFVWMMNLVGVTTLIHINLLNESQ